MRYRNLRAEWVRSSFCGGNGSCVEVAAVPSRVVIRTTRFTQMHLGFTREEWETFVQGVKAGEFDALPEPAGGASL